MTVMDKREMILSMSFHMMCSVLEGDCKTTIKILNKAINMGPHHCAKFIAGMTGCIEIFCAHMTENNTENQKLVKDWIRLMKVQDK